MTELSVEKISFHYNKRPVLSEITFDTTGGTFLSLLGPNGSGKTTLLRCLNSILRPNSGMVRLNRQPVPKYTAAELARRVAFLPQRCEMSGLTVFESVLLGRKPFLTGWQATGADLERVDETLDRLELSSLALRPLYRLSGGELQRAAIARLLVQDAEVFLLDEPASALDLKNQVKVHKLFHEIAEKRQVIIVMSAHNVNFAIQYTDRLLFLKDGRIFADTPGNSVTEKMIESVYGLPVQRYNREDKSCFMPL